MTGYRLRTPFILPILSKLTATELTVNKEPVDVDALKARLQQLIADNPELLGRLGYSKVEEEH